VTSDALEARGAKSGHQSAQGDESGHGSVSTALTPGDRHALDQRLSWVRPALAAEPPWMREFENLSYEWRRLFAELVGTALLVLSGAGPGMVAARFPGAVPRSLSEAAPGLMVMAIILATGAVSGAHLNPVVSIGFAMRREFPWGRVPAYVVVQLAGAAIAVELLKVEFGRVALLGATLPGRRVSDPAAMIFEAILTLGLLTVILGTASGAQNVGPLSAIAVGGYITVAVTVGAPVTGASMNPARSFGPAFVLGDYSHFWVYVAGPVIGAVVAVLFATVLRGRGGDVKAARAAQGSIGQLVIEAEARAAAAVEPDSKTGTDVEESTEAT